MKGCPSISPTVPPISVMTTSTFSPTRWIFFLDLICDMGDDLHGAAVVAALALALEDAEKDLTGSDGGIAAEVFIDEALVVAEVQVGLCAILGDENFAVLIGVHGAGVDVEIGVEFLDGHRIAARLEEPAQRGGG